MKQDKSTKYYIGIDEVGRGPLAGPVSICCFCVDITDFKKVKAMLSGITDSKKLSKKKREAYSLKIQELKQEDLLDYSISHVSASVIDTKGIMKALSLALTRSLDKLNKDSSEVFLSLDGGLYADAQYQQETIIKGDQKNWLISAASVLAKVSRDSLMGKYSLQYPNYGFEQHMGYGTKHHKQMISKHGLLPIHRKTWIH